MMKKFFIVLIMMMSSALALPTPLTAVFSSSQLHYFIRYPANWQVIQPPNGVVIFKEKANDHGEISINIQTIYTKKAGGKYPTVHILMNDFYSQVPMHTQRVHFLERSAITLAQPDHRTLVGEQTLFTFSDGGGLLKQWQVMVVTRDGNLFQAFAYRAPVGVFEQYRPVAAEMLESFCSLN